MGAKYGFWGAIIAALIGVIGAIFLSIYTKEEMSELEKNKNELLVIQNPTTVNLIKIVKTKWAGDKEAFYTLIFKNESSLIANDFQVKIDNGKIKFKHSNTSTVFYSKNLSLEGNKTLQYPLVSESELANYFKVEKEKILGIGLTPNIPKNILDKGRVETSYGTSTSVDSKPLFLEYKYETIFNQKKTNGQGIYVYINRGKF